MSDPLPWWRRWLYDPVVARPYFIVWASFCLFVIVALLAGIYRLLWEARCD